MSPVNDLRNLADFSVEVFFAKEPCRVIANNTDITPLCKDFTIGEVGGTGLEKAGV